MRSPAQLLIEKGAALDRVTQLVPDGSLHTPVYVTPGWLDPLWEGRALAITMPWGIYMPAASLRLGAGLIVHELVHVQQWRRLGWLHFSLRYLGEYAGGRLRRKSHQAAYTAISLEREARAIAEGLSP